MSWGGRDGSMYLWLCLLLVLRPRVNSLKSQLVLIYFVFQVSPMLLLLSHYVWLFVIPWTVAYQALLPFTISWSLHKFMSSRLVMLSNHLIFRPPPSSFTFNVSQHPGLFQWVIVHLLASGGLSIGASASACHSFQWIFRSPMVPVLK